MDAKHLDWGNPPAGALLLDVEGQAVLLLDATNEAFVFRGGAEPKPFSAASALWNGGIATPDEFEALIKAWPAQPGTASAE